MFFCVFMAFPLPKLVLLSALVKIFNLKKNLYCINIIINHLYLPKGAWQNSENCCYQGLLGQLNADIADKEGPELYIFCYCEKYHQIRVFDSLYEAFCHTEYNAIICIFQRLKILKSVSCI